MLHVLTPNKEDKVVIIHFALEKCTAEHQVFYEYEVDNHLNHKIQNRCDLAVALKAKACCDAGQNVNTI